MVEKSNGKLITNALSIIAAALVFLSGLTTVVNYGSMGSFGYGFALNIVFMLGGVALIVLSILALVRFSDRASRKVGMASVITFAGIQGLSVLGSIIQSIEEEYPLANVGELLIVSIFLLVFFFIFNAKYPAVVRDVQKAQPAYQYPVTQPQPQPRQYVAPANRPDQIPTQAHGQLPVHTPALPSDGQNTSSGNHSEEL